MIYVRILEVNVKEIRQVTSFVGHKEWRCFARNQVDKEIRLNPTMPINGLLIGYRVNLVMINLHS